MSSEEDTELRDLVAQTLEVNGCLSKIRAQLRASIFLALDEDEELQKKEPMLNRKIKTQLNSYEGRTMFCLVREFLEFFDLDFTISVYEPESYLGTGYKYEGRSRLIEDLGVSQIDENSTVPLLLQLIRIAQLKSAQTKNIDINLRNIQNGEQVEILENGEKTETVEINEKNSTSVSEELDEERPLENSLVNGILNCTEEFSSTKNTKLNETFNLGSTPNTNLTELKKTEIQSVETILSPRLMDSSSQSSGTTDEKEDTSITDDAIINSSDKSQGGLSETEFSPPILKDSKSHSKFDISFDKLKLSPQKTEKLKAKSSLSSLADLPPLQLNKSRNNNDTVLLPSLYSKEFKEKTANQNTKEFDNSKLFDIDSMADNYEEDFISDSEINLNKSLDGSSRNLMEELQSASSATFNNNHTDLQTQKFEKITDNNQNSVKNKTENLLLSPKDGTATSVSSSEDFNLNVDDILNSPTSN